MNRTLKAALGFAGSFGFLLAAGPVDKPADKPATSQPTGTPATMCDDQIHYLMPADPWKAFEIKQPDTVYFQDAKGSSAVKATWTPKDFVLSPDTDGSLAVQIMKTLKKQHQDAKEELVLGPKILKDKRFDIVIYERFKIGADQKVVQDQMHLYKTVGPRVMLVVVSCLVDDKETIAADHKIAEDLLVSCKFDRKAFKK